MSTATTESVADTSATPDAAGGDVATLIKGIGQKVESLPTKKDIDAIENKVASFERDINEKLAGLQVGKDNELEAPGLGVFKNFDDFMQTIVRAKAFDDPEASEKLTKTYRKRVEASEWFQKDVHTTSDASFLIPPQMSTDILRTSATRANLVSRARQIPVAGKTFDYPVRNDKTQTGFGAGNAQVFWGNEAYPLTTTKIEPLKSIRFEPKKTNTVYQATSEMLELAPVYAGMIREEVEEAFASAKEERILYGEAGNGPIGVLGTANAALITVARQTAGTVTIADLANMLARTYGNFSDYIWVGGKGLIPAFVGLLNAGGDSAYTINARDGLTTNTLMGLPVVMTDHAVAVGTQGDLSLVNMRQYGWATRGVRREDQSIHVEFMRDITTFRFIEYNDGQPLWEKPVTPKRGDTTSPFITLAA